jgi:hypothetical protein
MNRVIALLALLVNSALFPTMAPAADPSHIEIILKSAHQAGFLGCDNAIRSAFGPTDGNNMRVTSSQLDETRSDTLRLSVASGTAGESNIEDATIRRIGSKCVVNVIVAIPVSGSCAAFMSAMPDFNLVAKVNGIFVGNVKNALTYLVPVGPSCQALMLNNSAFDGG